MTLPTFLGIGVPKAGSTWLYELLAEHPQVYMPSKIKDVQYFNFHYDMGLDWYQRFFPPPEIAANYKEIGEFSARYLYGHETAQRIFRDLERPRLLLILRHPVDRTVSQYKHIVRYENYRGSFDQFLEDRPKITLGSFYSKYIKRYLEYFDSDQLLVLFFDRVFKDLTSTRKQIAEFLEIDPEQFPTNAGQKVVNKSYVPRYRNLYSLMATTANKVQMKRIYWPVYMAKRIGFKRLISIEGEKSEPVNFETRQRLLALFSDEITELETLLQTDLSNWRS